MADFKRQKLEDFISQADEKNEIKEKEIAKEISKFEKKIVLNDEKRQLQAREWIERRYQRYGLIANNSEADLAAHIKTFAKLSPSLYQTFTKLKGHLLLLQLLAHPNPDIKIQAVEVLNELVDEDVVDFENQEDLQAGINLVRTLIDDGMFPLLLSCLECFDEKVDDERDAVFTILSLIENCTSIYQPSIPTIITIFLDYLLKRLAKTPFDSIRGYTAELLSILIQDENSRGKVASKALETILPILAYYRKRDPKEKDEEEMVENIFDVLVGIGLEKYQLVVEQEGIELMLITIKEGKMAMMRAWGVLETIMKGRRKDVCDRFVGLFGLKSLFTTFKRKKFSKFKKAYPQFNAKVLDENCISIIYSLFLNLEDPELTRLLFKFIESDFESLHHLVILHVEYSAKVDALPPDIDYLDRLDRGLLALQLIDAVILQGCCKSEEIGSRIPGLLSGFNMSLVDVIANVEEYHGNLKDEVEAGLVKTSIEYAKELDKLAFKKPV